jgi:sirohydrochlorin cobaltochelatase
MTAAAHGLVLFAHGARDPRWATPFEAVAAAVRTARPDVPVRLAFLELMKPDLETAAGELVEAGCAGVAVVPLFLGSGGHVRGDLPALVARLRSRHPGVEFALHPAVGEHPAVVDAMARAAIAHLVSLG